MKRGMIIILLCFLLLAQAGFAEDPSSSSLPDIAIVSDPIPRISVSFSEDTKIVSATIYALRDPSDETSIMATYETTKDPDTEFGRHYSLQGPALVNANYLFEMIIADHVGNELTLRRQFMITYPETEMRVINPNLGVTSDSEFDLRIQTLRRDAPILSKCKYAAFNPNNDFSAFGLNWFDIPAADTRATIHQINNYARDRKSVV